MNLALVLLLAQTCVAEITFPKTTVECVAMWEINANNAVRKGIDIVEQTHAFNAYWRIESRRRARPWVQGLTLEGARPEGWPPHLNWERHRGRWLQIVARARRFVDEFPRGKHRRVCHGADDYGGDPDDGKAANDAKPCEDAVRITCIPGSLQAYWRLAGCRAARRQAAGTRAPK
ncbi:MAG: hypothetical protein IH804_04265 [Planctomycetes bacterium]|nr:hypothetical protein [Planctomycetota bacterium]